MTSAETLIENDLHELLGGETPPDLIERTLARLADGNIPESAVSDDLGSLQPLPLAPPRILLLRRFAVAACALLALGVMAWLVWPQPLPGNVTAATSASYRVKDDHIELKSGWLLLTDGAPEVRVDNGRVNDVQGRAVVGTGIPNAETLDALVIELGLSDTEKEMLKLPKRWLTAGGLAMCLLTGQAMLNDTRIDAEDLPKPEVEQEKIEIPEPDDIEGVRKLVRSAVSVEVMVDGKTLLLTDMLDVRRITEALTATGFATSEENLNWDPYDGVTMVLADGRKITTSGLSWEEDVYDMGLPGARGLQTYVTPGGAHDVLRSYFERAKKGVENPKPEDSDTGFRVLRKWEGADSAITEKRCEIVTAAEEWSELWAEHMAPELMQPPVLDFDKELVVAVFGGQGFNSKGFHVQEILKARSGWVMRVDETTYQTANGADNVSPFGIWVVPKDGGSILVEENVQGLLNKAPLWRSIGSRVATEDVRENLTEYQPSSTIAREGGPGAKDSSTEFLIIRSLNEWHAALNRIDDDSAHWPDPDFSNEIAVVAFGRRFSARGNIVLEVWGETNTTLYLRVVTPTGSAARSATSIFGLWVMQRPALDVAIESPSYGEPGTPAMWEPAFVAKRGEEPFGIYDDQYGTTDDADSLYLLIESQAELEKHVDAVQQDWVDWSTESVVLLRHGRKAVWVGMEATVDNGKDSHVLTYHLTAPSGVVADPINQYLVLKVKKPTATLVIKQSLKTGPAPAEVKEVARFEK